MDRSLTLAFALVLVGLLLLFAELFIPTGGLLFVLSVGALVVGVTMTFLHAPDSSTGVLTLIGVCVSVPAILGFMVSYWPKTRMGKRFVMTGPEEDATVASMPTNLDLEQLRGRHGRVHSALRPSGIVDFDGRKVDCMSEGMLIEPGEWVRCLEVKAGRVIVRQAPKPNLEDFPLDDLP